MTIPLLDLGNRGNALTTPTEPSSQVFLSFLQLCQKPPEQAPLHPSRYQPLLSAPLKTSPPPLLQREEAPFRFIRLMDKDQKFQGFHAIQGDRTLLAGRKNTDLLVRTYAKMHLQEDQKYQRKHLTPLMEKHLLENRMAQLLAIPVLPILNRKTALQDRYYVLPKVSPFHLQTACASIDLLRDLFQTAYAFDLPLNVHPEQFYFDPNQNQLVLCELPYAMKDSQIESFAYTLESVLTNWTKCWPLQKTKRKEQIDPRILNLSDLQTESALQSISTLAIDDLFQKIQKELRETAQTISPLENQPSEKKQKALWQRLHNIQAEFDLENIPLWTLRNLRNLQDTLQHLFETGLHFQSYLNSIKVRHLDGHVQTLWNLVQEEEAFGCKDLQVSSPEKTLLSIAKIRHEIIPFLITYLSQGSPSLRMYLSPISCM